MKRTLILLVMLSSMIAAALPLIAEGAQEQAEPAQPGQYARAEQIEVSGTVEFTAGHTRLNAADGEVYELMYPMYLADSLEIENGQSIDVEGFPVPGPRWTAADKNADEDQYLRLTKVTIDGEEYELAFGPGGRFAGSAGGRFQGRHPGRMGGSFAGRYDNRRGGRTGGFQQAQPYGQPYGPGMMGPRGY